MDTLGIDIWPWHIRGITEARSAIAHGHKALVYTSATGGGKTSAIAFMAKSAAIKDKRVSVFTNRKIITNQAAKVFDKEGIEHGTIAAGHELDLLKGVQLARIQTINSRVYNQEKFQLPFCDLALVDEGHGTGYHRILQEYKERGTIIISFTATPVNMPKGLFTYMVKAGTKEEMRQHGALVGCEVFCPNEPDMKGVKRNKIGEYVQDGMRKRVMQCIVFGDVF